MNGNDKGGNELFDEPSMDPISISYSSEYEHNPFGFYGLTVALVFAAILAAITSWRYVNSNPNESGLIVLDLGIVRLMMGQSSIGGYLLFAGFVAIAIGSWLVSPRVGQLNNHKYRTEYGLDTEARDYRELNDYLETKEQIKQNHVQASLELDHSR